LKLGKKYKTSINPVPKEKLKDIISQYGLSIIEEPQRCKGLLLDLCGNCKKEINALIFALICKIPEELEKSKQLPWEITKGRLKNKLIDEFGMVEKLSEWAIETWAEAINAQLVEISSENAEFFFNRGYENNNKGLYDQAIADYTKAIKLDPEDAIAYTNRGLTYDEKGLYDQAIADYTKAIKLDPEDAIAYCGRGLAYYNKGRYDKCFADYSKAIELDPKYADAYFNRGLVYEKKGLYDQAITDYSKAIELDPEDETASNNLKRVQELLKNQ
jgi:tetratricopeptide (TPR) repeat protein